jgi:hypothetical protein
MSGIASVLGGLLKDKYVAGLWSSVMAQGMAWQGLRRPQPQPINEYIGPSWSWASFQGIAALDTKPNWRSIATVEDWQIELTNPDDHYGQLKGASVSVRGPLMSLTKSMIPGSDGDEGLKRAGIRSSPRCYTRYSVEGNDMQVTFDNTDPSACDRWPDKDIKVLLLGDYGEVSPGSQHEVESEEAEGEKDASNGGFEIDVGFGLVLTSTNVNGATYMKRIGWTHLDRNIVKRLRERKDDWDTITIV